VILKVYLVWEAINNMAGIDYSIPGQFKGIQLESPMNAMAQAMQLRGLQEASQLNALRAQEYQQDVAEKNELAQIYANPKLKYGSEEFFTEVSRRAPRFFQKIATGEAQRQLALSTKQQREAATDKNKFEIEQAQRKEERDAGDLRLKQFNDQFPAYSIQSEQDVEDRILAMSNDEVLGPITTRFGTLGDLIANNKAEYRRDPKGYKARLSGVSYEKILEAAEKKDKEAYFAHVRQAIANKTKPMSEEAFMASRRQISPAAVSAQPSAAETPVSDGTAPGVQEVQGLDRNVPRPVIDASAAVAPNAAVSPEAAAALAPAVAKQQAEYTIHPEAQAYYDLFALTNNQADKAMGDAIQTAHLKQIELQNKPDQLMTVAPGGVVIDKATGDVKYTAPAAPEKPEPKTEAQRNYDAAIADGSFKGTFAEYLDQQKETEAEREYRRAKLPVSQGGSKFTGTFLDFKKLIAKANKIVVQPAPGAKPPDTTLDFLAQQYIQDSSTISAVPKGLRMAVINRAVELTGRSAKDMASDVIANRQDTAATKAAVKDFTSGKSAVAVRSFNTAIDHLETMDKLAIALQNNDTRGFNSVGNFFSKQFGAPAVTNFEGAKAIVGGEVAKALTGANMALKDREEIRDAIIASSSPEQLRGVLKTFRQLLGGQLNSLNIQYQTSTGRDDFRSKLSPASRRELDALNPQAPAASTSRQMSTQDQEALKWANANAKDPRAAAIKKRLGVK
jgi:hypothetical protein